MNRYQYALLRYVHDMAGAEFVNFGVVVFDLDERQLHVRTTERYGRISRLFGDSHGSRYRALLRNTNRSLRRAGERMRQPDLLEGAPLRLRDVLSSVLANDESCLQTSSVYSGIASSIERRTAELYDEFIRRYEPQEERERRDEEDIGRDLDSRLSRSGLIRKVRFDFAVQSTHYFYSFHAAWKNGQRQVLEPISFDLVNPSTIVEKATSWSGRLYNLSRGAEFLFTGVVAPPSNERLRNAYEDAIAILLGAPNVRAVIPESESERVIETICRDIAAHPEESEN